MTLWLLLDSAFRSTALGAVVWLGLKSLRVRNPEFQLTAWTVVLAAALAMPLLIGIATLTLPAGLPVPPSVADVALSAAPLQAPSLPAPSAAPDVISTPHAPATPSIDWRIPAVGLYLLVAGLLLIRMATGVAMMWRLARGATPIREPWASGFDVRMCDAVGMPVTFGRIILLPAGCMRWSALTRQAVLSHERSHVMRGDYAVLLLAALHRALFWFNPAAWWLLRRLAALMEAASDDAAIRALRDRFSYAEVLVGIAAHGGRVPAGVPMARPATVADRVARILRESVLPATLGWRGRVLVIASLLPATAMATVVIVRSEPPECCGFVAEAIPRLQAVELAPVSLDSLTSNLLAPPRLQIQVLPVSLRMATTFPAIRPLSLPTAQLAPLAVAQLSPSADPVVAAEEKDAQPGDVTGTWAIFGLPPPERTRGDTAPYLRPSSCTFTQTGDKLTGTCKNLYLETPITGSVKGRTVHFDWPYWLGAGPLTNPQYRLMLASFDGRLDADGVVRGSYMNMFAYRPQPNLPQGTFRAKRQS